jgi:hypothetical protein
MNMNTELKENDVLGKTLVLTFGHKQYPLAVVWLNEMTPGMLAEAREYIAREKLPDCEMYVYPPEFQGALPLSRQRFSRGRKVPVSHLEPGNYVVAVRQTVTDIQRIGPVAIIDFDDSTATPPIPANVEVEILDLKPVLDKYQPGYC